MKMNPTRAAIPVIGSGKAELGECPTWDSRLSRLYWVDIVRQRVHWLDSGSDRAQTLELEGMVGFVCLTEDPGVIIAGCAARILAVHLPSKETRILAELAPADAGIRCNDGRCDPAGRLWAGSMPIAGYEPLGVLYSLDKAGVARQRLTGIGCSNGLAWHVGRSEFYYIDSPTRRIDRYRWLPDTGDLTPSSPLATFAEKDGLPDGMCIDAEGHLWVAFWDGGCVRRIDGCAGAVLERIDLPVSRVTSCTFGGENFSTLFITTASHGLDPAEHKAQPLAGTLFQIQPGVRGRRADRFRHDATRLVTPARLAPPTSQRAR